MLFTQGQELEEEGRKLFSGRSAFHSFPAEGCGNGGNAREVEVIETKNETEALVRSKLIGNTSRNTTPISLMTNSF